MRGTSNRIGRLAVRTLKWGLPTVVLLTVALLTGAMLTSVSGFAQVPSVVPNDGDAPPKVTRPAAARGTVVVPDDFLRQWDPVTVFFRRDRGPAVGGAEPNPEAFVRLSPEHPGAYTWLDARTLQFAPAEPWPPLAQYTWRIGQTTTRLVTLMLPPTTTIPADGTEGLEPVDRVVLTFATPLDAAALARAVTLELRPLPGVGVEAVGAGAARVLTHDDFDLKVVDRPDRKAPASYVLALRQPVPVGMRVNIDLRLSLAPSSSASSLAPSSAGPGGQLRVGSFSTAEPFRAVAFGCADGRFPATPEGARYAPDQALRCPADDPRVVIELSTPPRELGPIEGRGLVRFSPGVGALRYELAGRRLVVRGAFARETVYRVSLMPTVLFDRQDRPLDLQGASEMSLYFPAETPYLQWGASGGIVERRGPRMVPVEGRGDTQLDLRLHRLDPLDRSFWPFPSAPILVDEAQRPPGPGERPAPFTDPRRSIGSNALATHVRALGSPPRSALIDLPLAQAGGAAATFGLDLGRHLDAVAGTEAAGSYLVGLRRLDASTERTWMRVQVTDLAVTTLEEPSRVVFVVTSMSTAQPVVGATVMVEGSVRAPEGTLWRTLFTGVTGTDGKVVWQAPGQRSGFEIRRLVVRTADDMLVLDPAQAPARYADNAWTTSERRWLQWTHEQLGGRGTQPEQLAHLFSERPVYRPEEPVHLAGYLQRRAGGRLTSLTAAGFLVIDGPGDTAWRLPIQPATSGSFYALFDEDDTPPGLYRVRYEVPGESPTWLGSLSFRKEAYRLPRFEVQLSGPDQATLDQTFEVDLTATYYAGGRVAGRPVRWRVTQFPYAWKPKPRPGFVFSSDGRFSRTSRFEASPALDRSDVTDDDGGVALLLNPALEATAQPRTYVVEATVTGADDQTVTATERIVALPAFLLGLKAPRYLPSATLISPEFIVLDSNDTPIAGQAVTVRLIHRQWHSHLQASDFSDGVARYITDIVDETVLEREATSVEGPLRLDLPIDEPGVYVVEIEAQDRLGRAQVVAVDLFAGGDATDGTKTAVAWPKPTTRVFDVTTDQARYQPGDTAHLVFESPFQQAEALVVIEAPEGNIYRWQPVRGGTATVEVPVRGTYAPRLPVHVLLMRGRVPGSRPRPGNQTDPGKPTTLGSTAWLEVEPVDNRVEVALAHPSRALPGQTVEVTVALRDPQGRPRAGEVALWLVDRAVLALGREQRLDPLPDFITRVWSHFVVRDTRNAAFGALPFAPLPGGGQPAEETNILDRQTVRRNLQPVPYFAPRIEVGSSGTATVKVTLPDNLTDFAVRAKALVLPATDDDLGDLGGSSGGSSRFGFATGRIAVRLPVILQPALPRFVRPGDRFVAAAIGRVVEGAGGSGQIESVFGGLDLAGDATQSFEWSTTTPTRLTFDVLVPSGSTTATSASTMASTPDFVTIRMGAERLADRAGDAFEVTLPVLPDRGLIRRQRLGVLEPGVSWPLPEPDGAVRPGSFVRRILVAEDPAVVRMAAGLSFLAAYPYGCTEQRIAQTRGRLALDRLQDRLGRDEGGDTIAESIAATLAWIKQTTTENGLVAYWPGGRGYVVLTAWAVELMTEVRAVGSWAEPAHEKLYLRLLDALERSLRSDAAGFIDGESWSERAWALRALAAAGRLDAAYASELARQAQYLALEDVAGVVLALDRSRSEGAPTVPQMAPLIDALWSGVRFEQHQGREIVTGVQVRRAARSGLMLPSEARTLASMTRALARVAPDDARLSVLVSGLVARGDANGWGSTNATVAALLALEEALATAGGPARNIDVTLPAGPRALTLGADGGSAYLEDSTPGGASLRLTEDGGGPVVVRVETAWLPAAGGDQAASRRDGFVMERTILHVQQTQGASPVRQPLEVAGTEIALTVGDVVEEQIRVVNPEDRFHVAIVVPLAAGVEPLNPSLATAPPEARAQGRATLPATYVAYLDDQVAYFYDSLPKGTYDLFFRTRATIEGQFTQPSARTELMYDATVVGTSPGARVVVTRADG